MLPSSIYNHHPRVKSGLQSILYGCGFYIFMWLWGWGESKNISRHVKLYKFHIFTAVDSLTGTMPASRGRRELSKLFPYDNDSGRVEELPPKPAHPNIFKGLFRRSLPIPVQNNMNSLQNTVYILSFI